MTKKYKTHLKKTKGRDLQDSHVANMVGDKIVSIREITEINEVIIRNAKDKSTRWFKKVIPEYLVEKIYHEDRRKSLQKNLGL